MARRIKRSKKKNGSEKSKPGKTIRRAAVIGFFGGIIWGSVGWICQLLNFSSLPPSLLLSPLPPGPWKHPIGGNVLSIVGFGLISVLIAWLYQLILSRLKSMWSGVLFGFFLWLALFYLLAPFAPGLKTPEQMGLDSTVTTLCLFILYGLFIGYSIAFEMEEASS